MCEFLELCLVSYYPLPFPFRKGAESYSRVASGVSPARDNGNEWVTIVQKPDDGIAIAAYASCLVDQTSSNPAPRRLDPFSDGLHAGLVSPSKPRAMPMIGAISCIADDNGAVATDPVGAGIAAGMQPAKGLEAGLFRP